MKKSAADWIPTILALRQGGGESTIQETDQIGPRSRVWMSGLHAFMLFVAFCFGCLGLGLVLWGIGGALARESQHSFPILELIKVVLGLGLLIATWPLAINQYRGLIDPYWRQSPFERAVIPYILSLIDTESEEDGQEVARLIPWRNNGRIGATSAEPEEPGIPLHPDDADLIDFLTEARGRGIARSAWVKGDAHQLPHTGNYVSRDKFDELIGRLVAWGYVVPGGHGRAATWNHDRRGQQYSASRVTRILLAEAEHRAGTGRAGDAPHIPSPPGAGAG